MAFDATPAQSSPQYRNVGARGEDRSDLNNKGRNPLFPRFLGLIACKWYGNVVVPYIPG